ncbi:PKD domain-containing protein [Shewanella cyperi]|uniref:PKD domain-containing protein n=1 Tax=Shewanella cyperi TaxID=2814292 RepID=UPI001A9455F0|nr:hypothetical protein [Shewanella cyperi]QSX41102.1 hypothetical protein JYB84_01290 [Shewanella cyperi]
MVLPTQGQVSGRYRAARAILATKEFIILQTPSYRKTIIASLIAASLSACGGGNDETKPAPVNQAPTVSVTDSSIQEGLAINLTAVASDSDGSISSYSWSQKSGTSVILNGANTASISFTAPAVTEDENLVFTVTVTDDKGATAFKDVTVTVTAKMLELTLQGKVTDGPIANAKVTVSVGEQEFITAADENGDYHIGLRVDDSYATKLINITAVGPAQGSPVKLVSLLGSLEHLIEQAGADGILTKDEIFGVNVTNVTSAVSALMQAASPDGLIYTQDAFDSAARVYDTSQVLPLATAVKLLLDYAEANPELAIPEGVANTQELITHLESAQKYLRQAQLGMTSVYEEALAAIISDENIVATNTGSGNIPIADSYYFKSSGGDMNGARLVLNADGTGSLQHIYTPMIELTWTLGDQGLILTYDGDGLWYIRNEREGQVEYHRTQTHIKWLSRSGDVDQMIMQHTANTHYLEGQIPDGEVVFPEVVQAVKSAGVKTVQPQLEIGALYSVPRAHYLDGDLSYSAINLQLENADTAKLEFPMMSADGSLHFQRVTAHYNYNDAGHLVLTTDYKQQPLALDYAFIGKDKVLEANVFFENKTEQNALLENALFLRKEVDKWSLQSVVGIFQEKSAAILPLNYNWTEINADGSVLMVKVSDGNADGEISEREISHYSGLWQITDNGNLSIRRYRFNRAVTDTTGYCIPDSFDPASTDTCVLEYERQWNLHQVVGDQYYVQRINRNYVYGLDSTGEVIQQHTVDYASLSNAVLYKVDSRPYPLSVNVQ